jgi:hypothetical protein
MGQGQGKGKQLGRPALRRVAFLHCLFLLLLARVIVRDEGPGWG